jgi:hypothetical protein
MRSSRTPYFAFDDCHEIRPLSCVFFAHLAEIDDIPVVRMCRAVVHLLAADVREDAFGVPLVPGAATVNLGNSDNGWA